jgi:alkanesulfonate monooxygenase SsuD/methylene tetrahydromethanopterin reductase-like flavin-dependent oxidoreductase (luciferase family)
VLPRIDEALATSGRSREDFTVAQGLILCIAEDREVARREAATQIAFYGTTPNYLPVFAAHGDEHLMDEYRRVFVASGRDPTRWPPPSPTRSSTATPSPGPLTRSATGSPSSPVTSTT